MARLNFSLAFIYCTLREEVLQDLKKAQKSIGWRRRDKNHAFCIALNGHHLTLKSHSQLIGRD